MVIIIGYGRHAKALSVLLREGGTENRFLREDEEFLPLDFKNTYVIGRGNIVTKISSGLAIRKTVYTDLFPRLVVGLQHKSSVVSGDLGAACQIMALSYVGPYASVGDNTIINTAAIVEHDCVVGPHCHIAPNATLCGNVKVGELTHIGAGSVVLQGLKIGSNCVVGAGSVVTRNMPDSTTWVGTRQR